MLSQSRAGIPEVGMALKRLKLHTGVLDAHDDCQKEATSGARPY